MKFIVSYLFVGNTEEGLQIDIVDYKDIKSCEKAYSSRKYNVIKIEEYDEDAILEEMYSDDENELNEDDDQEDDEDDYDTDEETLSSLFPNADTEEELEEELEHSFTRFMDN